MTEIDDRLRHHYRSLKLDDEALTELIESPQAFTDDTDQQGSQVEQPNRTNTFILSWAQKLSEKFAHRNSQVTAIACLATLVMAIGIGVHSVSSSSERLKRMLYEVAINHTTRLELEFATDNLDSINSKMNQLKFDLRLPAKVSEDFVILGARSGSGP